MDLGTGHGFGFPSLERANHHGIHCMASRAKCNGRRLTGQKPPLNLNAIRARRTWSSAHFQRRRSNQADESAAGIFLQLARPTLPCPASQGGHKVCKVRESLPPMAQASMEHGASPYKIICIHFLTAKTVGWGSQQYKVVIFQSLSGRPQK